MMRVTCTSYLHLKYYVGERLVSLVIHEPSNVRKTVSHYSQYMSHGLVHLKREPINIAL
jgi:hypothetical protein